MRDTSFVVSPIRDHAFFKQPDLKRLFGDNLLQRGGLAAQALYLVGGRRTGRITGKPTLASFQELLRPDVVQALGNALEAGKRRLAGDTARAATTDEVKGLRRESTALKEVVAEQALEIRLLKKSICPDGGDDE